MLMEALIGLGLLATATAFLVPLYAWVYDARKDLANEMTMLVALEEKRHDYYFQEGSQDWQVTAYDNILAYCEESVVKANGQLCVYALKK